MGGLGPGIAFYLLHEHLNALHELGVMALGHLRRIEIHHDIGL
jgi:hypothetical protein